MQGSWGKASYFMETEYGNTDVTPELRRHEGVRGQSHRVLQPSGLASTTPQGPLSSVLPLPPHPGDLQHDFSPTAAAPLAEASSGHGRGGVTVLESALTSDPEEAVLVPGTAGAR